MKTNLFPSVAIRTPLAVLALTLLTLAPNFTHAKLEDGRTDIAHTNFEALVRSANFFDGTNDGDLDARNEAMSALRKSMAKYPELKPMLKTLAKVGPKDKLKVVASCSGNNLVKFTLTMTNGTTSTQTMPAAQSLEFAAACAANSEIQKMEMLRPNPNHSGATAP